MGSNARRERIAAGEPVENAEAVRRRRRSEAAAMREELAIELWAAGKTSREISEAMHERWGVRLVGNVPALVRRGLYRRVKDNKPNVETAQALLDVYYRKFLEVYLPRGLGELVDDDGNKLPPDLRAAEFALKVLDKWGTISGAISPPRFGDVNLHLHQPPPDADTMRATALVALQQERDKQREIEGALAGTPAADDPDEHDVYDGMIMPPTPAAPTEER